MRKKGHAFMTAIHNAESTRAKCRVIRFVRVALYRCASGRVRASRPHFLTGSQSRSGASYEALARAKAPGYRGRRRERRLFRHVLVFLVPKFAPFKRLLTGERS